MEDPLPLDVDTLLADHEDLDIEAAVAAHTAAVQKWRRRSRASMVGKPPRYRGSVPGRRPNKPRDFARATDRDEEYCRLKNSTIGVAVKKLVAFIVEEHSPTYLRALNDEELDLILRRNAERGLPGRIGSLDCSHWEWRNCPKGMAGIHQNRKAKRSIIMETVCDEDLWIWHLFVGCPGSMNDLNVMYQSPLYHDVTSGAWPPRDKPFTVNGRTRTLLCYLVDGIYPHYPCFICAYPNTDTPKKKVFNRLQEAIRKDAERLYGVLNSRFHVAPHRARYATITAVIEVAKAIAILHNMVTEIRRGGGG
eukprot:contig_26434_g6497